MALVAWLSVAALAWAASPALASTVVRGLSLSASGDEAALSVDLSRATNYRLFSLAHPHRIVIDLSHTRLPPSARLPRSEGVVEAIRAGARPRDGLRLVLQLTAALPASAHWTFPGHGTTPRLVVLLGRSPAALASPEATDPTSRGSISPSNAFDPGPVSARAGFGVPQPVIAAHAPLGSDRDVIIAVDAGHGGQDPGAIGHNGTEEKTVTLAIARALAARIDAEPGMRAVLTRNRDVFLPLRERMRRARAARADLFVSIHADSVRDEAVSGSSVYVLSEHGATDEAARWLAERENAADELGGVPLADKGSTLASVLLDLSQSANISASMTAAQGVLAALERVQQVRTVRVQQAGFVVLKSPDTPSMLVETAYISNPRDERRLRMPSEQRELADAIFNGLLAYFEQHPPTGTHLARERADGVSVVLAGTASAPPSSIPP